MLRHQLFERPVLILATPTAQNTSGKFFIGHLPVRKRREEVQVRLEFLSRLSRNLREVDGYELHQAGVGGPRDGMKRVRECVYGGELDLETLVWTRGRDFPLARLESRLKCPRCGSRRVRLAFSVPPTGQKMRA